MSDFDVVVVGGGPAGGHGARLLAKAGKKVLLVEQQDSFYKNIFSSAGTPLETLKKYNLPVEVVGSFWQDLVIISTNVTRKWHSEEPLGAVLDFGKLRQFLADEVITYGGQVWLGHRYIKHLSDENNTIVYLQQKLGTVVSISTKVLVDATGFARSVMYPKKQDRPKFLKGTGIEYLIEVPPSEHEKYARSMIFFLGHKWMPKGYSWIFPMDKYQLKVGAAWINGEHRVIKEVKPLKNYVQLIIDEYLHLEQYKLIDVHGSIIEYSEGLKDIYYRDNVIAIGDTVSTINCLGGEGIRPAMEGAEMACKYIVDYLEKSIVDFAQYPQTMQRHFGNKWNLSASISQKVYLEYTDERIDMGVGYLKYLDVSDIMDVLFYYNFGSFYKGIRGYILRKIRLWIAKLQGKL